MARALKVIGFFVVLTVLVSMTTQQQVWAETLAFSGREYTHDAGLDFELTLINSKGKSNEVAKLSGSVHMNWESGDCVWESKKLDLDCKLDRSRDLTTARGEIVMLKMPRILFDQKALRNLLLTLSQEDKKNATRLYSAIRESGSALEQGLEVPWYSLQDESVSVAEGSPQLWSGFGSLFTDFFVNAPKTFGLGAQVQLRSTLKKIKPRRGVFEVTGSHSIGNY